MTLELILPIIAGVLTALATGMFTAGINRANAAKIITDAAAQNLKTIQEQVVAPLKSDIMSLRNDNIILKKRLAEVETENEKLREKLEQVISENEELRKENKELREYIDARRQGGWS